MDPKFETIAAECLGLASLFIVGYMALILG